MLGTIRHRGPDQFGILLNPIAALGSARLSIIDLSNGRQPISNEDQSLWIVYNGEVFNYIELRQDLEQRGHVFKTHSDTEVSFTPTRNTGLSASRVSMDNSLSRSWI